MQVGPTSSSPIAVAAAAQQTQTAMQAQVAMLREMAEAQAQMARLLADAGLGQNVDTHA